MEVCAFLRVHDCSAGGQDDKQKCSNSPAGYYCPDGSSDAVGHEVPLGFYSLDQMPDKVACTCEPGFYCPK